MKKILSMCLLLALTISLTACSLNATPTSTATPTPTVTPFPIATPTVAPLSKQYSTADELVADIVKLNNLTKALDALSKNTSIHHFFSKSEADNKMWKLLKAQGYSYENIYCMYAVCNSNYWFNLLNINGVPFAVYGRDTPYASGVNGVIVTKDSVINQIKDKFKDPYSVTIPGDMLLFPQTLDDPQSLMFPTPLNYAMWVGVRATNSFGAYGMEGIWIKISGGQVIFYDSLASDSEPKGCSLKGYEDTIIRISK